MAVVSSALRPFHRPRLWVGLWIAAIVVVIAVCLGPPPEFPELPSNSDKAEHFLTFALLCWGAVQLFATRRALVFTAFGLVLLGIGIEIAQGALTTIAAPTHTMHWPIRWAFSPGYVWHGRHCDL